jgi:hypothetical protein
MDTNRSLQKFRNWPRWTIIPVGLALAGLAIVLGLVLEPAAGALSPIPVEPTPTMPAIAYSYGHSGSCHDCHFSMDNLQTSADAGTDAALYLIAADSVNTPHGTLGCLACHGGDGDVQGKEAAHEGLIADMSAQDPEKCIICHMDIPDEIPNDRLRMPHGLVIEGVEKGTPCGVQCSDCHGAVGHGFDLVSGEKICSMTVCLDCHQERNLEVQIADCAACHLGPHDVPASMTCRDCHTSTQTWQEVGRDTHPMPLTGRHGETECFQCHQYPNFEGLSAVCADCHVAGHDDFGGNDCATCHDAGDTWKMVGEAWDGHAEYWDQYKGAHLKVACQGCHFEGYTDLDPNCDTCHTVPESHDDGRTAIECVNCHQADEPWGE